MNLLKVKARVCLLEEKAIEDQLLGELQEIGQKDKYLSWRDVSIAAADVKKIIQYDREKSVIITWDGDNILVKERHKDLHAKWEAIKEEEYTEEDLIIGDDNYEEYQEGEEGDEDEE